MTRIIADACCNHLGNVDLIETMIEKASGIGVDAIKFQAFDVTKLNLGYPDYDNAYKNYKKLQLSQDMYKYILDKCKSCGIVPVMTVFDIDTAKKVIESGFRNIKIASSNANDYDLIFACKDNKLLISTGMSTDLEIQNTMVQVSHDNIDASFFYCISKYPTKYEDINFDKMINFAGFSDHTIGTKASLKAIDLGMDYIERHFTLGKDLPGKDQAISSTLDEFKELVDYRNYKKSIENYKTRWNNVTEPTISNEQGVQAVQRISRQQEFSI